MFQVVYELAGIAGVVPDSLTLRELMIMAEGRQRSQWNQTASILAIIANVNRDEKKRSTPFSPSEFNPYSDAKQDEPKTVTTEEWSEIGKALENSYGKHSRNPGR